ncbi:hypothetical protein GGX14DRAFT_661078 [Mycena pura]|uniref:MYND-type domain-containing protein n=1 Tax=Mycena pura TaxID=153505 RepID=A0AAD6V1M1_9AGAR|nr:hypothetical protein GGX14DRAFT_661078 [Mycena pura]
MHPSLQLSNLSKLPPFPKKRADDALNGSHDAFHDLAQRIEKMIKTIRRLIIPVFYATLDPAHIGAHCTSAFRSLRTISIPLHHGDIPLAAFVDLWPRVWQCIEFLHAVLGHYPFIDATDTFALFMKVFTFFWGAANEDDTRAISESETPGTLVLIGTAWSYLVRTENSEALRTISLIFHRHTAGVQPAYVAFNDGLSSPGTSSTLSRTASRRDSPTPDDGGISLLGVMHFLYNPFKQGIIPALITIYLALSKSPSLSSAASDFVQPMALYIDIYAFLSLQADHGGPTRRLLSCTVLRYPPSYELHQPQLCFRLNAHLPACTVIFTLLCELETSFAEVKDLDPALHFRTSALLDAWRGFVKLLEERLQVARERKNRSLTKFRACDNLQCGQIRNKDQLKRCRSCLTTYYCSRICQKADYRDGGHRGNCWELQRHRKDTVSDHGAKNLFFRTLLNHDYVHQQEKIALMLLAEMHTHPQEDLYTVFNYKHGLCQG